MKRSVAVAAAVLLVLGSAVNAQQEWKASCTNTGASMPEPVDENQAISVVLSTCIADGGPMSGGVATQNAIWARDGGASALLSGDGVVRKPGFLAVYRIIDGKLTPVMKAGKPAGWIASGTAVFTYGSGDAVGLKGKTFSWNSQMTTPRRYETENRLH